MKSLRITIWIFAAFLAGASSSTGLAEDGASVSNLLQNTFDTSTPAVAAPWSMKPWLWEDDVNTSQAVWDLVDGCRDHDLPLGAIMIDSPWATRYNNFRFDEKRYPDARGMIEALHKRNVRVVLWMTNIINLQDSLSDAAGDQEDLYAIGKAKGYFVNDGTPVRWWKGKGALIDYTNPEAVVWWHRLMDRALSLGVDGWKIDGAAELFLLTRRQTSRGTLSLRDYMDLYYRDTLHYSRAWQPDFATMVRSVDIANSRNSAPHSPFDAAPLTWTGDQRHSWGDKGLDEAIRSAFQALQHHYPSVSSDTGGYQSPQKPASGMPRLLYLRWAQWNALTPFFLIGGHDEHRPWKFDAEFFSIFRRYMWLHQELVPFFYSQHVQASLREGKLMHTGPGKHEFLLGDALLVGVMDNEEPRRQITFPEGTWFDYWDNRVEYSGGQTAQVQVPEDRSPVFVRQGAIIPLEVENDALRHGGAASKGWRTFDIYPAAQPSQATVWDTHLFPPNVGRDRSLISVAPGEHQLDIRNDGGPTRDTILRVRQAKAPTQIEADGQLVQQRGDVASWEKEQRGWWFDAADGRLWIRLAGVSNFHVTVGE